MKCLTSYTCHTRRYLYSPRQFAAAGKCSAPYTFHAIWYFHTRQLTTTIKRPIFYTCHTWRYLYALQVPAIIKRILLYGCYTALYYGFYYICPMRFAVLVCPVRHPGIRVNRQQTIIVKRPAYIIGNICFPIRPRCFICTCLPLRYMDTLFSRCQKAAVLEYIST